jgi:membrane-associated protease RseP (regulator of RpoE activity)
MSQTSEHPRPAPTSPGPPGPPGPPHQPEPAAWLRVLALIGALVAIVWLSLVTGAFPVVAFVLAMIAAVMLHEAGHFFTAKWTGMKVTEFFFGFGPRLWSIRRGETEYGAKAIPAGGYVKILGMSNLEKDIDPADEPRTYRQQSYPRRLLVGVAGIITHFIVAFLLLVLVWTVVGVPRDDRPTLEVGSISRLETGPSPAQEAGFQVGDRVVSVDGRPVTNWQELPPYIRARPGEPITFVVERDGAQHTLVVTPARANPDGEAVGFVGIGSKPETETVGLVTAAGRSAVQLGRLTVASVKALGLFFSPGSLRSYGDLLTGTQGDGDEEARPVSLVGAARIADQAADQGLFDFLGLLVLLNVFFAVFNAVPLLPLDGGHIAVATYERIRSRRGRPYRADVTKLLPLTAMVVAVLAVMGLTSVWLDIVNPLANPFQ